MSLAVVAAAWAGFTGPNRTTTQSVRDPGGDQWYCDKSGYSRCWFSSGNPCPDEGGSHPSGSSQMSVCGWPSPGDDCGCDESYRDETVNLPPATVGGSNSCSTPGNDGWCRGNASLALSASEPLSGEVIQAIEGAPGGILCDPADAPTINCAYSGGDEGNFTIEFWALSSYGDTSDKGSTNWKLDSGPPSVNLTVSGGTPGGGGWYRGGTVDVSVSGADSVSGVAAAEVSINGGGWSNSANVAGDGIHSISARVTDAAGNQATDGTEVRIDGTPPSIQDEISGTRGKDGWFVSPVTLLASASDSLSGVTNVQVSDGGGWQASPLVITIDGTHKARFRAEDVAGNVSTADGPTIKIDARAPESVFVNPPNGSETWVSGMLPLLGKSSDLTSGLSVVEMSFDDGGTWLPLELAGSDWRESWDSTGLPNGTYVILARAQDVAGNLGAAAAVTLHVDNLGPRVDIPDEWPVSEEGQLTVEEGGVGIDHVEVLISSGAQTLVHSQHSAAQLPQSVKWDGMLPSGAHAAPGRYAVHVTAWDLIGNHGSDAGAIVVPAPEPEPEPVVASVLVSGEPEAILDSVSEPAQIEEPVGEPLWIWPAIAWLGLMGGIGLAKAFDPRAQALRDLRHDIKIVRGTFEG